jgi:hypothetical protein
MIQEVIMWGAVCDHCKKEWEGEVNGWTATKYMSTIELILGDEGWAFGDESINEGKDGEIYCPDCFEYDDEDNFELKVERKNKHCICTNSLGFSQN